MYSIGISEIDGRYLELYTSKDTSPVSGSENTFVLQFTDSGVQTNKLWIADLQETDIGPNMKWYKISDDFEASYGMLAREKTIEAPY